MQGFKSTACNIAASGMLLLCSAAPAQDWRAVGTFGWMGSGKAYEVEKGHFYWVGEFTGTFFSDKGEGGLFHMEGVKCPAYFDLDANRGAHSAGGYCIVDDGAGSQAYLAWQNKGDGRKGAGTFTYTGGTGKYQGISGSSGFGSLIRVNWADGTTSGYATWNR
jgi:hypothetical protein